MILGRRCPIHGGRGHSHWIGRQWLLILILVSCVCVCGCVLCVGATISYHTGRKSTSAKANGQLLQGHRPKFLPKHLKYKWMIKLSIIQRCCTCFDLLVQSSVGHATSLQKRAKFQLGRVSSKNYGKKLILYIGKGGSPGK